MTEQAEIAIAAPSLPKGGGAIQSIGKGWGAVGTSGASSLSIPLPISPGRGFAPAPGLQYSSVGGNGVCGIGWSLSVPRIARRTAQGVPAYTEDEEIVGPGGDVLMPERDPDTGAIIDVSVDEYDGQPLDATYRVVRYFPRVEGAFDRIECWTPSAGSAFWLVHGADGTLHLFGKRAVAQIIGPADPAYLEPRIAEWLLEESVNPYGEHILYEYQAENVEGLSASRMARDHAVQRYLHRVRYGNQAFHAPLYLWNEAALPDLTWHFDLMFDYGERATDLTVTPTYAPTQAWPVRLDPLSAFSYGFEINTLRVCRQVLMFHHFPELGPDPVLVQRLLFEYEESPVCARLTATFLVAYDDRGVPSYLPPWEFAYEDFTLGQGPNTPHYQEFEAMPGLNDGQAYQLVDLYGEGMPGALYRSDRGWLYREPVRSQDGADAIAYADWQRLPTLPVANSRAPVYQTLTDLTGDGRLDWILAQPGWAGFFTLGPDRHWSHFASFAAFPVEFFQPQAQLADLMGAGLPDLAMIGPRSVRVYANRREAGFAPGHDVSHDEDDGGLPGLSDGQTELVAFCDILGSGQQHLVRIRHDGLTCWPNLGRGRFGKGFRFAELSFKYEAFDASRIRLADLDGSGAVDLIYLESEHASIFMNRGGNGFDEPYRLPWPAGIRYDRLCQVSAVDLQGLGCASLVLTVPHMTPRHWRCDFVPGTKPYLLRETNNNMGAAGTVRYRSSAQEWLDEKQALQWAGREAVSELPFPIHLVVAQTQFDEITGNALTQHFKYRQGYYDGSEREFRGFGLLEQTDAEALSAAAAEAGHTAPVLTKTWFHTGSSRHDDLREGYDSSDAQARPLGATRLSRLNPDTGNDDAVNDADDRMQGERARALSGSIRRVEVFGLEIDGTHTTPYSINEYRYQVRQLQAPTWQRYAVLLPLLVEHIAYRYERVPTDPTCQHLINLRWDRFGVITHGAQVSYARRLGPQDASPLAGEYEQKWWRDSHDASQTYHYLTESLNSPLHLDAAQAWRLALPYRSRTNAMSLPRGELAPEAISYESFLDPNGAFARAARTLAGLSVQHYQLREDGMPTLEALPDYTETTELDETALRAYDAVLEPAELENALTAAGYHRMAAFLPDVTDAPPLWSVHRGFATYAEREGFRKVIAFQPTRSHGVTSATYDAYACLPLRVTEPDGCVTEARYDYRGMVPLSIVDPNRNTQEALYDAFDRLIASSFYGTENGVAAGFAALAEYERGITAPEEALDAPAAALQDAASACFYGAFSWMGQVPPGTAQRVDMETERLIMPTGHIRASAWRQFAQRALDARFEAVFLQTARVPVHSVVLQADRYPGDPAAQIQISLAYTDGFGRVLQAKQKVEPGEAYAVSDEGDLQLDDEGVPVIVVADPRWRVSERVEYNNKGLVVRAYRPYFANRHRYIRDVAFRLFGYCDTQYYDSLGRPTRTVTAKGHLRRQTYWAWYVIAEDENDTAAEVSGQGGLNVQASRNPS
jgi:hypothetical protein